MNRTEPGINPVTDSRWFWIRPDEPSQLGFRSLTGPSRTFQNHPEPPRTPSRTSGDRPPRSGLGLSAPHPPLTCLLLPRNEWRCVRLQRLLGRSRSSPRRAERIFHRVHRHSPRFSRRTSAEQHPGSPGRTVTSEQNNTASSSVVRSRVGRLRSSLPPGGYHGSGSEKRSWSSRTRWFVLVRCRITAL